MVIHITFRVRSPAEGANWRAPANELRVFAGADGRAICRRQIDGRGSGFEGENGAAQSRDDIGIRGPDGHRVMRRPPWPSVARFQSDLGARAAVGCGRVYWRQPTSNESFTWSSSRRRYRTLGCRTQPKPSLQVTALRGVDARALRRTPNYQAVSRVLNRSHRELCRNARPSLLASSMVWNDPTYIERTPGEL